MPHRIRKGDTVEGRRARRGTVIDDLVHREPHGGLYCTVVVRWADGAEQEADPSVLVVVR